MAGADPLTCDACGARVRETRDFFDFVRDPALREEREHFEAEYAEVVPSGQEDFNRLRQLWYDNPYSPWDELMLEAMGDLRDEVVVVLGNGPETKELYLLHQEPRALVISDLSTNAVSGIGSGVPPGSEESLFLAAIDGQDLPFADGSVGVLYGYAFVHHLPDIPHFLREASRVLKPGGRAVFMDSSRSPVWQAAKTGSLRRLMHVAHTANPISSEDQRFTLEGGFITSDLDAALTDLGCVAWFAPTGLLHYLVTRLAQIFLPLNSRWNIGRRYWRREADGDQRLIWPYRRLLEALLAADRQLERFQLARDNRIRLVWGFEKPPGPETRS